MSEDRSVRCLHCTFTNVLVVGDAPVSGNRVVRGLPVDVPPSRVTRPAIFAVTQGTPHMGDVVQNGTGSLRAPSGHHRPHGPDVPWQARSHEGDVSETRGRAFVSVRRVVRRCSVPRLSVPDMVVLHDVVLRGFRNLDGAHFHCAGQMVGVRVRCGCRYPVSQSCAEAQVSVSGCRRCQDGPQKTAPRSVDPGQ